MRAPRLARLQPCSRLEIVEDRLGPGEHDHGDDVGNRERRHQHPAPLATDGVLGQQIDPHARAADRDRHGFAAEALRDAVEETLLVARRPAAERAPVGHRHDPLLGNGVWRVADSSGSGCARLGWNSNVCMAHRSHHNYTDLQRTRTCILPRAPCVPRDSAANVCRLEWDGHLSQPRRRHGIKQKYLYPETPNPEQHNPVWPRPGTASGRPAPSPRRFGPTRTRS